MFSCSFSPSHTSERDLSGGHTRIAGQRAQSSAFAHLRAHRVSWGHIRRRRAGLYAHFEFHSALSCEMPMLPSRRDTTNAAHDPRIPRREKIPGIRCNLGLNRQERLVVSCLFLVISRNVLAPDVPPCPGRILASFALPHDDDLAEHAFGDVVVIARRSFAVRCRASTAEPMAQRGRQLVATPRLQRAARGPRRTSTALPARGSRDRAASLAEMQTFMALHLPGVPPVTPEGLERKLTELAHLTLLVG
jgi:hypothetical protein